MPNKKNIAKASLHAGGNINIGDVINYYINIDTPLPNGVNPLSNYLFTGDKATKYKQYLSGNILDYVSRDDFKRKNNLQKFLDESEIIKNFLMKDDMEGCIISGEGGVGKTRLLIQIGLYAFSQRWNVFFLTTRFSDFRTLANFLEFTNNIEGKHNGKHLLIIDYTEECNWYTPDFIEEIFTYNPNLKVKVIANCRNSFISSSNYPHSYYQAKLFESENEKEYQKHVINNILSPIKINIGNIDRFDFHSLKPSYAVFLRYLYESGKQLDILESGDFKEWLKKRFLATINVGNDFSEAEKAVIYLMSLPTNNNEALFNYNENKVLTNQIERLVNNGWIDEVELETGEIVYQSIHDTITDELLILLLEAKNRRQNIFFKDSIEFASAFKKTTNWIRSFERINGASSFDTIAFVKFIENCIDECEYLVNNKYELATTSLFEEEERIKLINNHLVFFSEYTKDILFGFPLSFALNVFSKKKSIPKGLKPLADNWLLVNKDLSSDRNIAHRIISTYIKLFGYLPEIKSHFEIYLTLPQSPWSSYVIKSFIDKTENIDFITKYTIQYLQNFAVTRQASFVLSAWLDKDGDKEIIQDFLIQYLVQNAKEKEARFILGRWLDKDGDKGIIQDFLIQYLEQNATEKENSFVLSAWLDKDGVKGIIQDFLIQYLEQNAIEKETSFDFKAWLDKDGDKGIIQDFLIQYLELNAKEKEARYVFKAWLDKDGDKEIIQDFLIQYLEQNAKDEEARYVFDAFLKRSIEIKNIEIFLKKFLEKYSEKDFASYVIHPYLKNYKDLDFIKPYFGKWLDNFVNKINTRFDLQFWLQKSSDYDFIKPYILKWLNQYYNNYFASYILQTYLDKTGDFITIKDFIYEWLPLHGENKGANYLLQSVIAYEQQSDIILPYCNKWLAKFGNVHSAHFLIVKWLEFHSYELLKAEIDSWLLLYSYSSAGERIVQMIKKQ